LDGARLVRAPSKLALSAKLSQGSDAKPPARSVWRVAGLPAGYRRQA